MRKKINYLKIETSCSVSEPHNALEELKDFMRVILGRESLSGRDSFSSPGLCLGEEKEKRRPPDIASVRAQSGSQ